MSKEIELLRQAFNRRLENMGTTTFYAEVKAVDEATRTCTVEMEGIPYAGILLYAVEKTDLKGAVMIPAVGSTVLVSRIGGERYFVAMFSVVDRIIWTAGEITFTTDATGFAYTNGQVNFSSDASTLSYVNGQVSLKITASGVELSADSITLNGGKLGGLVKIAELKDNLDSLKTFVEDIHAAIPAALAGVGAAMAANGALGKQAYDGAMAGKTVAVKDMENTRIKQ